jgi:hypothetical protein
VTCMHCSHLMAACAECGIFSNIDVSDYFQKESIVCT